MKKEGLVDFDPVALAAFRKKAAEAAKRTRKKAGPVGPPKVEKVKVSKKGAVSFKFNQKLKIPQFIDPTPIVKKEKTKTTKADKKELRRFLGDKIPLDKLDVTKSIFGIKFFLKSDVQPEQLQFYIEVKKWTPKGIDIEFDFKDP